MINSFVFFCFVTVGSFVLFLISKRKRDNRNYSFFFVCLISLRNELCRSKMSDILGVFDERNENDNLVEFLTKFARFGIEQCLHLTYLIANKQRSIDQDKRVRNDFYFQQTNYRIDFIRFN
jgi:hypothetical protein